MGAELGLEPSFPAGKPAALGATPQLPPEVGYSRIPKTLLSEAMEEPATALGFAFSSSSFCKVRFFSPLFGWPWLCDELWLQQSK